MLIPIILMALIFGVLWDIADELRKIRRIMEKK